MFPQNVSTSKNSKAPWSYPKLYTHLINIIQSELSAKRDVEKTPKCTCPNWILAQGSHPSPCRLWPSLVWCWYLCWQWLLFLKNKTTFLNGQRMKDNVLSIYSHNSSQPIPVQWLTYMIKFHSFDCSSIQLLTTLAYTELASTSARQGHI